MRLRTALAALALAATAGGASGALPALPRVSAGFTIERIATVPQARELAFTPSGDLFVGTYGPNVYIVPNADAAGPPAQPSVFASFADPPAAGVAVRANDLYVGTQFAIRRLPYRPGDRHAAGAAVEVHAVRTSEIDRDHETTSLTFARGTLYAAVGSSCNACDPELDATRATVDRVEAGNLVPVAIRIRNAIALATDPATGSVWAGVAGEDDLPLGHPYEIFDPVTLHRGVANYGWPYCYENRKPNPVARWSGRDCSATVLPRVVFPAYETPIGAVFYPSRPTGRYAFPAPFRGGAFVTLHGSWHGPAQGLPGFVAPQVVFVPMRADVPVVPVDWSNPRAQWQTFVTGYQRGATAVRIGRPTGIAVGPQGDLFIADDLSGAIYRVRPR